MNILAFHYNAQQLTNHGGFQVDEDGPWDVLPTAGLTEEGGEGLVMLFLCHSAIGLDAVLQAVQLPAGVAHLHASLPHVNRNTLTLQWKNIHVKEEWKMLEKGQMEFQRPEIILSGRTFKAVILCKHH